jgi:Raf kinase inhibitor-like YbhB/YbcL family protein
MRTLVAGIVLLAVSGCGSAGIHDSGGITGRAVEPDAPRSITVTSPAFDDGGAIPSTYTCKGKGISPPLQWSGVDRDEIGSLALVVDDPDAPGAGFVHWVVLHIPTGHGAIDADEVPDGASTRRASGGLAWSPPCPPSGTHHYRFTLYAFPTWRASATSADMTFQDRLSLLAEDAVAWGRLTGTVRSK